MYSISLIFFLISYTYFYISYLWSYRFAHISDTGVKGVIFDLEKDCDKALFTWGYLLTWDSAF